jgi:hypothetical protein
MKPSDATVKGILAALGIIGVLLAIASLVAFLGFHICVGKILFTDAENDPQFMTTLLAFWWMQTVFIILDAITKCCRKSEDEDENSGLAARVIGLVIALVIGLVFITMHIFGALLLFTNLGNNPQFMNALLVLWSILTAVYGIMFIIGCCGCYCILIALKGSQGEAVSHLLSRTSSNPGTA